MAVFLLLALSTRGGGHASQEPQAQQRPTFRTEANYVRVDAYPTRDGDVVPDLAASGFELLEDGVVQRIEQCEFVRVQAGAAPRPARQAETVASGLAQAGDARARVFVFFLDAYHVGVGGSARMRTALPAFLRRMLGPDDVIGVLTPQMPVSAIALTRRTEPIEAHRRTLSGLDNARAFRDLLDRTGKPITVPVTCSAVHGNPQDPASANCDITLAPLAAGDYGILVAATMSGRRHEVITAFRVQ
jgi:hypothetical protein